MELAGDSPQPTGVSGEYHELPIWVQEERGAAENELICMLDATDGLGWKSVQYFYTIGK